MYRPQLNEGLNRNASAATKAREVLRELLGGRIDLKPEGEGELWAEYGWQLSAVLQVVGFRGSGGRLVALLAEGSQVGAAGAVN